MDKIIIESYDNGKQISTIDIAGWTIEAVAKFYKLQESKGYTCKMKRLLREVSKCTG